MKSLNLVFHLMCFLQCYSKGGHTILMAWEIDCTQQIVWMFLPHVFFKFWASHFMVSCFIKGESSPTDSYCKVLLLRAILPHLPPTLPQPPCVLWQQKKSQVLVRRWATGQFVAVIQ